MPDEAQSLFSRRALRVGCCPPHLTAEICYAAHAQLRRHGRVHEGSLQIHALELEAPQSSFACVDGRHGRWREAYREDGLCMRRAFGVEWVVHEEGTHDGLLGWPVFTDRTIGLTYTRTSKPSPSPPWASLGRHSQLAPTFDCSTLRTLETGTSYHQTSTTRRRTISTRRMTLVSIALTRALCSPFSDIAAGRKKLRQNTLDRTSSLKHPPLHDRASPTYPHHSLMVTPADKQSIPTRLLTLLTSTSRTRPLGERPTRLGNG
jgi:hypothetical protein